MRYKYIVIGDSDTLLGFRAAGVPGIAATSREEALAALAEARRREAGVIILTQDIAEKIRAEVDAMRFAQTLPMLVEIPGPAGPLPGRRRLEDVIREAVGIRV